MRITYIHAHYFHQYTKGKDHLNNVRAQDEPLRNQSELVYPEEPEYESIGLLTTRPRRQTQHQCGKLFVVQPVHAVVRLVRVKLVDGVDLGVVALPVVARQKLFLK